MKEWLREGDTAVGLAAVDTVGSGHMNAAAANNPLQPLCQKGHNLLAAMLLLIYPKMEMCVGRTSGGEDSEMMMPAVPTPAWRKEVGRMQELNRWEGERGCWT